MDLNFVNLLKSQDLEGGVLYVIMPRTIPPLASSLYPTSSFPHLHPRPGTWPCILSIQTRPDSQAEIRDQEFYPVAGAHVDLL